MDSIAKNLSNLKTTLLQPSEEDKKSEVPPLSFCQVVKLNSPEWKSITVGSISSIILGFSMPLFIVVFGDLFGVS